MMISDAHITMTKREMVGTFNRRVLCWFWVTVFAPFHVVRMLRMSLKPGSNTRCNRRNGVN